MSKLLFAALLLVVIGLAANPLGSAAYQGALRQGFGPAQAVRPLAPISPPAHLGRPSGRQIESSNAESPLPPEVALAYANAARQLCLEVTADGSVDLAVVYLVRATAPELGTPNQPQTQQYLPVSWQNSISGALSDLPIRFVWVDSTAEAVTHPDSTVSGRAIVTFGNVYREESNGWTGVSASLCYLH